MVTEATPPLTFHPADLAVQTKIRLPLPVVEGNCDYKTKQELLCRMDEILNASGVENEFVAKMVAEARDADQAPLSSRRAASVQTYARQALRCTIARILSNSSHRIFSVHLAESPLLQWFCGCDSLHVIHVPSKSTLQRMESEVPKDLLDTLNAKLLSKAAATDAAGAPAFDLESAIDLSLIWMDSTCAKLDIHYPTDWTLLRDATRSIMRAIEVIRRHGICHRMPEPKTFVSQMNRLSMAMSGSSRKGRGGDKLKQRKRTLRMMKQVVGKVRQHGQRYRDLLAQGWKETDLSKAQADVIIGRLDGVLEQLPAAIKQAHERIIGGRVVNNADKILSLHEPHARVYVRGKAGADAEFGLQLLLSETAEGLIVDSHLVEGRVANDTELLMPAVARIRSTLGSTAIQGVVTDRGFSSDANSQRLEDLGIEDATLPRRPQEMEKFLAEIHNRELHVRRAQTEARIGIFKANFLGDQLPTKGFENQQRFVAWATLAHNCWVLARLPKVRRLSKAG